jgi:YjjG family noncanonical pyrimidine nucleotidase
MKTTLLLDLDNTLLDFNKGERMALKPVLDKYGIEDNEENRKLYSKINLSYWKKLERKEITREEVVTLRWKEYFSYFHINSDGKEVNDIYFKGLKNSAYLLDGALDFLKEASKYFNLYIISNGIKEVQDNRLLISGIKPYFKKIFISEEMGYVKPEKEFFDLVLKEAKLTKDECIVIGDSLSSDIQGAINSNIDYIYFDSLNINENYNDGPRCTTLRQVLDKALEMR